MAKAEFKKDEKVVVCPRTLADAERLGKLMSRTKLTETQLKEGPITVLKTDENQITIKYPKHQAVTVHPKFFVPATQA